MLATVESERSGSKVAMTFEFLGINKICEDDRFYVIIWT
jgi:hypothetical protein